MAENEAELLDYEEEETETAAATPAKKRCEGCICIHSLFRFQRFLAET